MLRAVPIEYIPSYVNRLAILWVALMVFDLFFWGHVTDVVNLLIFTIFNDYLWWRQYNNQ